MRLSQRRRQLGHPWHVRPQVPDGYEGLHVTLDADKTWTLVALSEQILALPATARERPVATLVSCTQPEAEALLREPFPSVGF